MRTERGRIAVRARIGIVRRAGPLLGSTVRIRGLVDHAARRTRLPCRDRNLLTADILDRLALLPWADVPVRAAPDPVARRARLAAAAVHQPELLLIDGLLDGLDPLDAAELAACIRDIGLDTGIVAVRTGRRPSPWPAATSLPWPTASWSPTALRRASEDEPKMNGSPAALGCTSWTLEPARVRDGLGTSRLRRTSLACENSFAGTLRPGEASALPACAAFVPGASDGRGLGQQRAERPPRQRGSAARSSLRIFAIERFVRALAFFGLAYGLWRFRSARSSISAAFNRELPVLRELFSQLGYQVDHSKLVGLIQHALTLSTRSITLLAIGLAAYALVEVVEGTGLWLARRWGEYFAMVATSIGLPLEIYELTRKVTATALIFFVVNLALVLYLILTKRLFGVRGGKHAYEARLRSSESVLEAAAAEAAAPGAAPALASGATSEAPGERTATKDGSAAVGVRCAAHRPGRGTRSPGCSPGGRGRVRRPAAVSALVSG